MMHQNFGVVGGCVDAAPSPSSVLSREQGGLSPHTMPTSSGFEVPTLDYVHGFTASAGPTCLLISDRLAAVVAGKLVVLLHMDSNRQRFIHGHSAAVTCMAHSPQQALGASGQVRQQGAKFAEILLWCPETLRRCATFGYHQETVDAVCFAQRGEILVSIGRDRDRTLAIWASAKEGWFNFRKQDGPLAVASAYKSGCVHGVISAPCKPDSNAQFATFGSKHVKFWNSDHLCPALDGRRGCFGNDGPPREVVAAVWLSHDRLVAGGIDGEIHFFEGTRSVRRIVPYKGISPFFLAPLRGQGEILAVFSSGVCALMQDDGTSGRSFELASLPGAPDQRMQSPVVGGAVGSRDGAAAKDTLLSETVLVATETHLLKLSLTLGGTTKASTIFTGCETLMWQAAKPLTGVCAHPVEPIVYTSSIDGVVRCYKSDCHEPLPDRSFRASAGVTCLAVSGCPPGESAWLAVGCEDSTLSVLSETSYRYVFRRVIVGKKVRLTCARFSPCDAGGGHPMWLAVGTNDGCIHTFCFKNPLCRDAGHSGAETVVKVATLQGHIAPVVDVSFAGTLPCVHLLSADAAGQALIFDVSLGRRLPSLSSFIDVPFSPWTCPVGWQVAGCCPSSVVGRPGGGFREKEKEQASLVRGEVVSNALSPTRRFCEVVGRGLVAAVCVDGPDVQLYPFPCACAPQASVPRLSGPASSPTALAHSGFSDCLLCTSRTALFVWSWGVQAPEPKEVAVASPVRIRQGGGVLMSTPDGKKRVFADDGIHEDRQSEGLVFTPPPRTPSAKRHAGTTASAEASYHIAKGDRIQGGAAYKNLVGGGGRREEKKEPKFGGVSAGRTQQTPPRAASRSCGGGGPSFGVQSTPVKKASPSAPPTTRRATSKSSALGAAGAATRQQPSPWRVPPQQPASRAATALSNGASPGLARRAASAPRRAPVPSGIVRRPDDFFDAAQGECDRRPESAGVGGQRQKPSGSEPLSSHPRWDPRPWSWNRGSDSPPKAFDPTMHALEDTEMRARQVQQRQQLDSVGPLLACQ